MSNNQNTPKKGENTTPKSDEAGSTTPALTTLKPTPSLTPPTPEPDPVAQAKADYHSKQIQLGSKFQKLEELTRIRRNLTKLTETRDDLRLFRFDQAGDVSNVATLILRDSTGREFSTNRVTLIEEQVEALEIRLNSRINELQDEALLFQIA
ncbi:hypothetical protein [Runella sp.]|uniref:hypothetical protein n=1 Tax=Runella sp. TaxID=1960881 RepID=UPI003D13D920